MIRSPFWSWLLRQGTRQRPIRRSALQIEHLERRSVPSRSVNWTGAVDSNWSNPNNWDVKDIPGPMDDVYINVSPGVTIQHSGGDDSIQSLHSQNPINLSGGS